MSALFIAGQSPEATDSYKGGMNKIMQTIENKDEINRDRHGGLPRIRGATPSLINTLMECLWSSHSNDAIAELNFTDYKKVSYFGRVIGHGAHGLYSAAP